MSPKMIEIFNFTKNLVENSYFKNFFRQSTTWWQYRSVFANDFAIIAIAKYGKKSGINVAK